MKKTTIILLLAITACTTQTKKDPATKSSTPIESDAIVATIISTSEQLNSIEFQSGETYTLVGDLTAYNTIDIVEVENVTINGTATINASFTKNAVFRVSQTNNILIDGLYIKGDINNPPLAGVFVSGHWSSGGSPTTNTTIRNCEIEGVYNGVRGIPSKTPISDITIENCVIHEIREDGFFVKGCPNFKSINSEYYRVNRDYYLEGPSEAQAPGDGGHLIDCANYYIDGNVFDKSDSPNKFCFIFGAVGLKNTSGTVINNLFVAPPNEGNGGANIYIHTSDYVLIEGNTFVGNPEKPLAGLLSYATKTEFLNNTIVDANDFKFTLRVEDLTCSNNIIQNATKEVFYYYHQALFENNTFCNFGANAIAYYTPPGSGASKTETGTVYKEECDGITPPPDPDPDPCDSIPDTVYIVKNYYFSIDTIWTPSIDTTLVDSSIIIK